MMGGSLGAQAVGLGKVLRLLGLYARLHQRPNILRRGVKGLGQQPQHIGHNAQIFEPRLEHGLAGRVCIGELRIHIAHIFKDHAQRIRRVQIVAHRIVKAIHGLLCALHKGELGLVHVALRRAFQHENGVVARGVHAIQ